VKVGAFVAAGLVVAGLVVFMVGDERRAFETKARYFVVFDDVQGLTRGAPVRMGGVDVGQVASVGYGQDLSDNHLRVTMDIVKSEALRIRSDSVATIGNKGLLGDKMVVIRVGTPDHAPLPPGSTIKSEAPEDLSAIADRLGTISEKAEVVMGNLQKTTETLADPDVRDDLKSTVKSLSHILKALDEGDGYAARLLKDPAEADRVSHAVANLEHATAQLDQALGGTAAAVARVNQGPGFAHDLIYGQGATDALAQLGHAAGEVATTLEGIRAGNGLAHSAIYGDDATQQLIGDLNAITHDVRGIVDGLKAGKGTLGALMVDPSVYEDVKLLLGNVERNRALRALVRYSIQKDERTPQVQIVDPGKTSGDVGSRPAETKGAAVGAAGRLGED
jgi:phospholipid/cholesterol/gamma-HCH transport system substrate-binding protein